MLPPVIFKLATILPSTAYALCPEKLSLSTQYVTAIVWYIY